jgi:16S rRNA (guanine(966)-N(2))-methyltransferase RsmD
MRIVAGKARGRPLLGPKGQGPLRPTADRVRETLFNVLGQWFDGQDVLDLFAGTGALALEALSRGARKAVLVDSDKVAIELCRKNAEALGFLDQVEIWKLPFDRGLERLGREGRVFQLVFADPPYAARVTADILDRLVAANVLDAEATVCVEHDRREAPPEKCGPLVRGDSRRFGDTVISLYRFA